MATPGEVQFVARSVWQGLLSWWYRPEKATDARGGQEMSPASPSKSPPGSAGLPLRPADSKAEPVWTRRSLASPDSYRDTTAAGKPEEERPTAGGRPRLLDGLRDGDASLDPTDEELMEFLAADNEPVEADPEFKRKLRDQLWTLVQGNEMTRQ